MSPRLHRLGMTTAANNLGHRVRCYDAERTICDLLRSRSKLDAEILPDALRRYAAWPQRDLNRLMEYASRLRVQKAVRIYLETLL